MERYLPLSRLQRLLVWLGFHVHDPRVFCVGEYAVVKCTLCGMESVPWPVSKEKADAWRESHPTGFYDYQEIDRRVRESN